MSVFLRLDHFAVAGLTLDAAVEHVEAALGVAMQTGGQHARYGTHNCLLHLADGLYIEAISVDPAADAPAGARWFDLDRFSGAPRITNWICAGDHMDAMRAALPQAGDAVALARGDLRWTMAVPANGILPMEGAHPALIQWQTLAHPSTRLEDKGCSLRQLTIRHPQADELTAQLAPYFDDPRVVIDVGDMGFEAAIDTPHGLRILR